MPPPRYDEGYGDYTPQQGGRVASAIIPQRQAPGDLANLEPGTGRRPGEPGVSAGGRKPDLSKRPKSIEDMLREFFESLNAPLDFNDPYVRSILENARQTSLQGSGSRGIFGPYSENMAQQAYIRGAAGLQEGRRAQAGQALGALSNYAYQRSKDAYQADLDRWRMQGDQNLDLWRLGGGIVGGAGGAILGGITGNIPGAIAGASAGWGLGQQAGGAIGQGFGPGPMPQWNPPRAGGF